jgi:hypothetical protein
MERTKMWNKHELDIDITLNTLQHIRTVSSTDAE